MARGHEPLFGLLTLALVGVSTYCFVGGWLRPHDSDRLGFEQAIGAALLVTGTVFAGTELLLAWFTLPPDEATESKTSDGHTSQRLDWTWTLVTAGVFFFLAFTALSLWAHLQRPAPVGATLVPATARPAWFGQARAGRGTAGAPRVGSVLK